MVTIKNTKLNTQRTSKKMMEKKKASQLHTLEDIACDLKN